MTRYITENTIIIHPVKLTYPQTKRKVGYLEKQSFTSEKNCKRRELQRNRHRPSIITKLDTNYYITPPPAAIVAAVGVGGE